MQMSSVIQNTPLHPAAMRDDWIRTLHDLAEQVSEWARQEPEWHIDPFSTASITEEPLGTYAVPLVTIHAPQGRLILEPIARNYPGRGIVELYAWPTLFRVRLLRGEFDANWQVRVDSGFILHQEWNRNNFIQLAKDLLGAS